MNNTKILKEKVLKEIAGLKTRSIEVANYIFDNPFSVTRGSKGKKGQK